MPKNFKCPFCNKRYISKDSLYNHIENLHKDDLPEDMTPAHYYFNYKYKKEFGKCVICGKQTEWNESVERYNRFCSNECKEKYKKDFQAKMIKKYGKTNILDDPDQQKKMLQHRKISGTYTWSDGKSKTPYTGSYELDFLKFLDLTMQFEPVDVIAPAPQVFYYELDGKKRFYIPDFYIASINTLVEIKDGGDNPNRHQNRINIDGKKEKIKDELMLNQKNYNYLKLTNKDYSEFIEFLIELKNENLEEKSPEQRKNIIRINESEFFDIIKNKIIEENTVGNVAAIPMLSSQGNKYVTATDTNTEELDSKAFEDLNQENFEDTVKVYNFDDYDKHNDFYDKVTKHHLDVYNDVHHNSELEVFMLEDEDE